MHLSTLLANKTIEYLQKAEAFDPDKPWFIYLAPAATHSPHQAPKEWLDKYKASLTWDGMPIENKLLPGKRSWESSLQMPNLPLDRLVCRLGTP